MKQIWSEILEQIGLVSEAIGKSVNPPATPDEIRRLEETIGITLPEDFCNYLSTMNGQRNTEECTRDRNSELPLLGFHPFLSITGIIETWAMMNKLFAGETEPIEWVTEDKIKPFIWRRHWIPFTESEGSQYLILDCDPGKNGTYGQVFCWCAGMDFVEVTASSFGEFSKALLSRLSERKFEITELGAIEFEDYYI